jgi:predicted aspartyl protease
MKLNIIGEPIGILPFIVDTGATNTLIVMNDNMYEKALLAKDATSTFLADGSEVEVAQVNVQFFFSEMKTF